MPTQAPAKPALPFLTQCSLGPPHSKFRPDADFDVLLRKPAGQALYRELAECTFPRSVWHEKTKQLLRLLPSRMQGRYVGTDPAEFIGKVLSASWHRGSSPRVPGGSAPPIHENSGAFIYRVGGEEFGARGQEHPDGSVSPDGHQCVCGRPVLCLPGGQAYSYSWPWGFSICPQRFGKRGCASPSQAPGAPVAWLPAATEIPSPCR